MTDAQMDLTNAYYLELGWEGYKPRKLRVFNSSQAVAVFEDSRDHGNDGFGYGASQMRGHCGRVTDATGKHVATISYNGRVWFPDGKPLDAKTEYEWVYGLKAGSCRDAAAAEREAIDQANRERVSSPAYKKAERSVARVERSIRRNVRN